jgi:hypothetical protein
MPLIKSFRPVRNIYFRSGRKVLFGPDQYLSSQTRIIKIKCFIWDESDSTIGNLRLIMIQNIPYLAIIKFTKQYFRFHFIITQDKKSVI